MRIRFRQTYTPEQLAEVYSSPNEYTHWHEHVLRVNLTIGLGQHFFPDVNSVADLSAGATSVIVNSFPSATHHLGDFAERPGYQYRGMIEDTIHELPSVDLFICSETLEHVDDPDQLLRDIRVKAKNLLLSTPNGETTDENPEHYWGWDDSDIRTMLSDAGWHPLANINIDLPTYRCQIWACW